MPNVSLCMILDRVLALNLEDPFAFVPVSSSLYTQAPLRPRHPFLPISLRPACPLSPVLRRARLPLRPCLRHTYFPESMEFVRVPRVWPATPELCKQYMVLTRRVRTCLQAARVKRNTENVLDGGTSPSGGGVSPPDVPGDVVTAALSWERPGTGVDSRAVSATLDKYAWFSTGGQSVAHAPICAWAAVRVHHRCPLRVRAVGLRTNCEPSVHRM
jgi:hypothetical protein